MAKIFHKSQDKVLRDIERLACSQEFNRLNFELISYFDSVNREQKAYEIAEVKFSFLIKGWEWHNFYYTNSSANNLACSITV
jgi:Rha family phage regulatory protein